MDPATWRRSSLSLVAGALLTACGGDDSCAIVEGVYQLKFEYLAGDCPSEVQSTLEERRDLIDVPAFDGCGYFVETNSEVDELGCVVTEVRVLEYSEDGIAGRLDYLRTCSGGNECTAYFGIEGKLRATAWWLPGQGDGG